MRYAVNFGSLSRAKPIASGPRRKFRLAVLGDFSGGGGQGPLGTRKPIKVDVDRLDAALGRLAPELALPLAEDGGTVRVKVAEMDDFHPDRLVENVPLLAALASLRKRLKSRGSFDAAAKEVLAWGGAEALPATPRQGGGATVAPDRRLDDFARLSGRALAAPAAPVDDLLRRIVGAHVVPAKDARQDALVARVDAAMADAMRRILHHPDFQALEAAWRTADFLVRRLETGTTLEIVLFDVAADAFAADLAGADTLEASGLHALLVEQPALDADAGPFAAILGLYGFELAPPHADLLGRMARIAAAAEAPFLAGLDADVVKTPFAEQHRLVRDAWGALREMPEAAYLGLAAPRVLLRAPYGERSDPIDGFDFEEVTRQGGLGAMVWANGALIPAFALAKGFEKAGAKLQPGSAPVVVGDMPYFVFEDADGEQTALPCTERLWGERQAAQAAACRVMPVVSLRGRPEVRLAGFAAVGAPSLAGFWAPVTTRSAGTAPEPAVERVAPAASAPEAPAEAAPAPAEDDLDALLANLGADPAPEVPAEAPAAPAEDDLDALLASLGADPAPSDPDANDADLDALLASLK